MLSKILKGKSKNNVIDIINNKNVITPTDISNIIKINDGELIEYLIKNKIKNQFDLNFVLDDLIRLIPLKPLKNMCSIIDIILNLNLYVNWELLYVRFIEETIFIHKEYAECLLNKNLVTIDTDNYLLIRKYINLNEYEKLDELIFKYKVDINKIDGIYDTILIIKDIIPKMHNYLIPKIKTNNNKKFIKAIIKHSLNLKKLNYYINNNYLKMIKTNIYYIIYYSLHFNKFYLIESIYSLDINVKEILTKSQLNNIKELIDEVEDISYFESWIKDYLYID